MKELHLNIRNLLAQGWSKKKISSYYIFLEKDNVQRKISLNNGKTVSEKNIVPKVVTEPSA